MRLEFRAIFRDRIRFEGIAGIFKSVGIKKKVENVFHRISVLSLSYLKVKTVCLILANIIYKNDKNSR